MAHATREAWLEAGVEALRPVLTFAEVPRVSVGFPKGGGKGNRAIGQCWAMRASTDGRTQIFVSPVLADPVEVLAVLLHELIHHKIGTDAKHGAKFRAQMKLVGLEGKATATIPSAQCSAVLAKLVHDLGEYPHAGLKPGEGITKKQSTRLLKAACPSCECTVRITAKWAGENGETLPICGYCAMPEDPETFVRMTLSEGGKEDA